jgi:hypothetical protein
LFQGVCRWCGQADDWNYHAGDLHLMLWCHHGGGSKFGYSRTESSWCIWGIFCESSGILPRKGAALPGYLEQSQGHIHLVHSFTLRQYKSGSAFDYNRWISYCFITQYTIKEVFYGTLK